MLPERLTANKSLHPGGINFLLNGSRVLVAEDEPFIALDIALAIEDAGGEVVGPACSIKEALALIEGAAICGAILDFNLIDGNITPVAEAILRLGIPVILQSGVGCPPELAGRFPNMVFLMKPCVAAALVAQLDKLICERETPRSASYPD